MLSSILCHPHSNKARQRLSFFPCFRWLLDRVEVESSAVQYAVLFGTRRKQGKKVGLGRPSVPCFAKTYFPWTGLVRLSPGALVTCPDASSAGRQAGRVKADQEKAKGMTQIVNKFCSTPYPEIMRTFSHYSVSQSASWISTQLQCMRDNTKPSFTIIAPHQPIPSPDNLSFVLLL